MYALSTRIANRLRILLLMAAALTLGACDATEPEEEGAGEEEVITTVILTLEASNRDTEVAEWSDPDGPGGDPPMIDDLTIRTGIDYTGRVEFLDRSDPADVEDITEEVAEEADEHQVFYTIEGGLAGQVTLEVTDSDADGLPVGLEFTVRTDVNPPAFGSLRVVLSHFDDVAKDGVNRSPETDVEVVFDVNVLAENAP